MDGPGHLLALKVMRVSRPGLASGWEPFYSSSPAFSAHSTTSILSLQGSDPLPGHPKTLRDLSNPTTLLTLPASFGSIQLGETFSSCLCLNNEASFDVRGVSMRVEMQTATTKTVLAEIGGPDFSMARAGTVENVVSHEIKELGQHVLACTISYRLPPNTRHVPPGSTDANDPTLASFRKFYKFAVTNPLSVKTKVHVPRSPSALLSRTERETVFLEVHIQNLTQEALWFERMHFDCAEGWQVQDPDAGTDLFAGSNALMQPQDVRQYVHILSPTLIPTFPITHPPGTILPLGRLDLCWRSSFGEPGRLITSMLSRRIPLPPAAPPAISIPAPAPAPGPASAPVHQPASAVPPYLQRKTSISRPGTPQIAAPRPKTPPIGAAPVPYRSGSPFRNRTMSVTSPTPGVPVPTSPVPPPPPPPPPPTLDFSIDLTVRDPPRTRATVEEPFTLGCTLAVSAPPPPPAQKRLLKLAIQHLQAPRAAPAPPKPPAPLPNEPFTPRLPSSGFSTPTTVAPSSATFGRVLEQKLIDASSAPRRAFDLAPSSTAVLLPPPFAKAPVTLPATNAGVTFLGGSAMFLHNIVLTRPPEQDLPAAQDDVATPAAVPSPKVETSQDFELVYLPVRTGFVTVGGLRALLIEDRLVDDTATEEDIDVNVNGPKTDPQTLKEWDVLAELWVTSA